MQGPRHGQTSNTRRGRKCEVLAWDLEDYRPAYRYKMDWKQKVYYIYDVTNWRLFVELFLLVTFIVNGNSLPVTDDDTSVEVISLNESQYCFVDQNTVRVSDDFTSELQDIVNRTEKVIISTTTNSTVIFIAPSNGARCSSEGNDTLPFPAFIILMIIYSITVLVAIGNIILHLIIKDLRTLSGVLVMIMCSIVILFTVFLTGALIDQFLAGENERPWICTTLVSFIFFLILAYQAAKLVILFHFAHLMYKTYKVTENDPASIKHLMVKYIIFILVFTTSCFLLAILLDFAISGNFYTEDGTFCFSSENSVEVILFPIIILGECAVLVIFEVVLLSTGLGLYFLVSKSCCKLSTTKVRVVIALAATVGINIILVVVLYMTEVSYEVFNFSATTGTLVEQVILFFIFLSSRKVCTKAVQLHRMLSSISASTFPISSFTKHT